MTSLLRLDSVSCGPGQQGQALWDIRLELNEGGIGALLGGSGAGKSTLLETIAGVRPVDRGRIVMAGNDITTATPAARKQWGLGWATQSPRMISGLRAGDHVSLGLDGAPVPPDRLGRLFVLLPELEGLWSTPVSRLGRRARRVVDLARALVAEPRLLLLDELALDLGVDRMLDIVARLGRSTTLLVAERYPRPLLDFVDRVWVIGHGWMLAEGDPADLAHDERLDAACIGELPPPV